MRRPDIDDPDLPLSDLFFHWPDTAMPFLERRMLCPGCPIAPFHTLLDACGEYCLDEEPFRQEIKKAAGL
ncbi:MAG: hypothetical protein RI566_01995 [Sediminimonas sp.]|uniref:DUF1858 domain-containing protein n=1 Tax=Sediminimonas qiaohouensis TaxID=552061 RepID=A0A7C9HKN5_9RHOB|nr:MULTISPECIES: hypothetical protein [Sediminimonas]MDR9483922.1 hypothetical protein [Sediminimonas sp.]MTJ05852.1 hypothetical protein [Sediminimonas qiaohouensis]